MVESVRTILGLGNPYDGFPAGNFKLDLQGWGAESPLFDQIFQGLRPRRVAEVGTWKGASAIRMASLARQHEIEDFELVCIDTWLGSPEHWKDATDRQSLNRIYGMPQIYFQFLANVIQSGHTGCITPLPQTTTGAAHLLAGTEIRFDAIYIDAAHEYREVKRDLEDYWPLLRPGGLLFGDDFNAHWHGVIRAVSEFAEQHQRAFVSTPDEKWIIHK